MESKENEAVPQRIQNMTKNGGELNVAQNETKNKDETDSNRMQNIETNYQPELEDNCCSSKNGEISYSRLASTTIVNIDQNQNSNGGISKTDKISKNKVEFSVVHEEWEIQESLLVFLNSFYHLIFTIIITYWHYSDGKLQEASTTLSIFFTGSILIHLFYAFNRNLKKLDIWNGSKIFAVLTLIPGTLTLFMSFGDLVFSIKENKSRSYERKWKNTRGLYLVESLVLLFPQVVFQSVLLLQDHDSIPKLKGLFVLMSMGIFSVGISLSRIRYDSCKVPNRFGTGLDKILRSTILWGNKGLWLTTYVLLVSTCLLRFKNDSLLILLSIGILFIIYELPLLLSSFKILQRGIESISSMFFILPQFISLTVLVIWVNTDDMVYVSNIGVCALGAFSWFESLAILGWLLDSCSDREMDIMPLYPHLFGDFYIGNSGEERSGRRASSLSHLTK